MSDEQTNAPQEPTAPTTDPANTGEHGKANREAARYRVQLRETEQERDRLLSQLTDMRRAGVTNALAGHLTPEAARDVAAGMDPDTLAGMYQDGAIDPDAIAAYAQSQTALHPYMAAGYADNQAALKALHDSEMRRPLTGGLDPKGDQRDRFATALGNALQRDGRG